MVSLDGGEHDAETYIKQLYSEKNGAYKQRNECVAMMAKMAIQLGYDVWQHKTTIEGWDKAWHNCVYIELPTGQVSWHFHDSEAQLFSFVSEKSNKLWDLHDNEIKLLRMKRYLAT